MVEKGILIGMQGAQITATPLPDIVRKEKPLKDLFSSRGIAREIMPASDTKRNLRLAKVKTR